MLTTTGDILKILVLFIAGRVLIGRLVDRIVVPVLVRSERSANSLQAARVRTLASLLKSILQYVLIFVTFVMLLRAFRLDPLPLLTTASVAGLAVGFGSQKLVKDVISGFFILLEDQYAIGDYVTIVSVTGIVEDVGMRTTRIRDDVGKLYIISNGDITQVCNQSRGDVSTFVEIGIAATASVDNATEIINACGDEVFSTRSELKLAAAPRVQGLSAFDGAKLTLRVSCPVSRPENLQEAQVALRGLIHQRFAAAEILIA